MRLLALANVLHRPLRTGVSVLFIAVLTAQMITALALSYGTLNEVARRVQSVDAELVVLPQQENVIFTAGAAFSDKYIPMLRDLRLNGQPAVRDVIPILFDTVRLGGQQQRLFGIQRASIPSFIAGRRLVAGRWFDQDGRFEQHVNQLSDPNGRYDPDAVDADQLRAACELVIDTRLARVGNYRLGDQVQVLSRPFRIVGIVETGVAGRVFCSLAVLRHIKMGGAAWSSTYFVKLSNPALAEQAADALARRIQARVELKGDYGKLLWESFAQVFAYMMAISALLIFGWIVFVFLIIYTMVLERTREIGILKALGASRLFIVRQTVCEALIIAGSGTAGGMALSFVARWAADRFVPLLTVDLQPRWFLLALVIGLVGAVLSAAYPGYRAARLDPIQALNYE
jgi:putative ABC transport system permease protein